MSKNPPSLIAPRIQAIVDAPPPPKEAVAAGNQRRISDKVRRALQLLATGKCKQITDAALQETPIVKRVIVLRRTGKDV